MTPNPVDFLPNFSGVFARVRSAAARIAEVRGPSDPAARYPCAIIAVAAAMALHILLWPHLGASEPYITFYAAVAFVAVQWGIGPAIVTGILSGLVAQFFVLPPAYMVPLRSGGLIARWITFLVVSAAIIGVVRVYRLGMKRLAFAQQQLQLEREAFEQRIRERTAAFERMQQLRQRLMARLMRSQEEERHRISRNLQDDFSQRLAVFCIDLDRLRTENPLSPALTSQLTRLKHDAERLSLDVRDASYELDYSDLRLGLLLAVQSFCGRVARQHSIDVRFDHQGNFDSLPEALSVALFRVLQEALANSVKHGRSTEILVSLSASDHSIELRVRDNGRGFDLSAAPASDGLGLLDMHERMIQVGGSLRLDSFPAQGTEILAAAPLRFSTSSSG